MNETTPMLKSPSGTTIDYYNVHAKEYCDLTRDLDLRIFSAHFLAELPPAAHILDAGCGSGRDTKLFLDRGYRVTAIDASSELARLAAEYTNQPCEVLRFQEMEFREEFDGAWASASLLHLPKYDMYDVIPRFIRALKPRGIFYLSFKEGEGERIADDGRFYCDYTRESLQEIFTHFPSLHELAFWRTEEIRKGGNRQIWLSLLFRKTE
jgi:SAM-dependent methyltransferase